MSDLSIEHRGYTIRYGQNDDQWSCMDLGVSAPTLSKVKEKINAELLKVRKASAFDCFYLDRHYVGSAKAAQLVEARAIDFKTKSEKQYPHGGFTSVRVDVPYVGIMSRRRGERASKHFEKLDQLVPIGPETDLAMLRVEETHALLKIAQNAYDEAVEAIPRLTMDDVKDLARAAEEQE